MIIKKRNKKRHKVETNSSLLLNEDIRFSQILLVSEGEKKIVIRQEALAQAKEAGLDLLCVAPLANPPVCKLVNYYRLSKELKRKRKGKEKKEKGIDISFNIKKNDLETKLNKIFSWVEKGSTVRVNLVRKGKERS
jgi:translation initiation factor IF-3